MNLEPYINASFKPLGRGPAYDCWGLVHAIYKEQLKIELPSYNDQYFNVKDRCIASLIDTESKKWVRVRTERESDVIVLKIAKKWRHVGIIVEPGLMVHILENCWVVIESYKSMLWRNRIVGIFRYNTC